MVVLTLMSGKIFKSYKNASQRTDKNARRLSHPLLLLRFVVMLMQRFELCNLLRSEERFDLRVCALHQRLNLLMFLLFGQARVLEDRF